MVSPASLGTACPLSGRNSTYRPVQISEASSLISYGIDMPANHEWAAYYVDKILKGANVSDLPIEFPTKLTLTINIRTAKALGLEFPPARTLGALGRTAAHDLTQTRWAEEQEGVGGGTRYSGVTPDGLLYIAIRLPMPAARSCGRDSRAHGRIVRHNRFARATVTDDPRGNGGTPASRLLCH
jgi:hypothetical protein